MKDKKCILLVRVSTEAQSYDEQEKELREMALQAGYKPSKIVAIKNKESGISKDEEERDGLNEMKEKIRTGEYDCVFAWEISRIARRNKILFSIKEFLLEHRVQLIIKEPYLQLLKPNYEIDEGAELIFSLYAQLAEAEMRNKKSRFERAKREYYAKGKYMGGKYLLGYTVNEDGYWIIDEETAPIVRMVFDMYVSGEYSMTEIAQELYDRGYFPNVKNVTNVKGHIQQMLKNESYRGVRAKVRRHLVKEKIVDGRTIKSYPSFITDNNNIYPQIIDDETWEKCVKRRKENLYRSKSTANYLLTPLIHCQCGASFCANSLDGTYQCRTKHNAVEKGMEHDPAISINLLESLVWFVTLQELHRDMAKEKSDSKEVYEKEIGVLQQKKARSEEVIASLMKLRENLDEAFYVDNRLTKEKYEELARKQNDKIAKEQENIRKYDAQMRQYAKLIESETTFDDMLNSITQSFDSLREGTDIETMKKLIRRYIVDIHVEAIEGKAINYYKKVTIETINDVSNKLIAEKMLSLRSEYITTNVFYANAMKRACFYDQEMTDEVPMVYMERIKRRREHTTRGGAKVSVYPEGYIRDKYRIVHEEKEKINNQLNDEGNGK